MGSLIEVAHFYDPEEAYCARSYLTAHGVETIIKNEHHLNVAPFLRVGLGGYPLLVVDKEAESAKQLLENPVPITSDEYDDFEPRKRMWLAIPMGLDFGFAPLRRTGWFGAIVTLIFLAFFITFAFNWIEWLISSFV